VARHRNRDGVWVEHGVCKQGYNVGQDGVVRKLSGGVKMRLAREWKRQAVRDGSEGQKL
jgi:hypothetical protein